MLNKNVLFVGDLRTAKNYGAIMTTESLMNMVKGLVDEKNLKYIDFKSFYNPTPTEGWNKSNTRLRRQDNYENLHVPIKIEMYDEYAKRVLNGELLQYELNLIKWSDIVYINSEGNIVNGTDAHGRYRAGGLYVLFIAYFSKKYMNKKVCIVNHTVDPGNTDVIDIIKRVYPILDFISVRERLSYNKLKDLGIHNINFIPDALFSYVPKSSDVISENVRKQVDFTKPYICIGDSSGIRSGFAAVKWDVYNTYKKLVYELKKIIPQIVFIDGFGGTYNDINRVIEETGIKSVSLNNCNYHELYHVLSNTEIFISGRWHASILSALGNTPILLWGADSHKTLSLYELLDYPYRFFETKALPIHIDDICKETKKVLKDKKKVKKLISQKVNEYRAIVNKNVEILKEL